MSVPPFHGNISFHAQHSPMGAFFSFTCGHFGSRGGFGLQIGKPGDQNLYIGVKDGDRTSDAPLKCLPFFEGADADEAQRFDVEKKAAAKKPGITSYRREEIQRHYGWATDKWVTPDFEFAIYAPFGTIPDPNACTADEFATAVLPAVFAELTVDNRAGKQTKTAIFAIKFAESGVRLLDRELDAASRGFAVRSHLGVAGQWERVLYRDKHQIGVIEQGSPPIQFCSWDVANGIRSDRPHLLGNSPGLAIEVPAGEIGRLILTLGCYLNDYVTTRLPGKYAYTRHYTNLEDVLNRANTKERLREAGYRDHHLAAKTMGVTSHDQDFLIAHATRSYYGSTQLLDVGGQPFWVVNEGEYCMMNTLDLSVDQVFWELKQNPWVVRNLLDNFVRHYSYVDQHGLSFCHDMGVHNQFSPFGHSSYELPNLDAVCFSYMTCEELCNWILIAASYVNATGDVDWAAQNRHVIDACYNSLIARGGEAGFCQHDSSRCGDGGAEITTYDSLDHSLAQTRNNLYMAVKTWAAYLGIQKLYGSLGLSTSNYDLWNEPLNRAYRVAEAVVAQATADGSLPAVFEKENSGYSSRILPAIEGLLYPHVWKSIDTLKPHGVFADLLAVLKKHTLVLLKDSQRRNLFEDGGIKLSSTSNNSWMSKIAIFQHVCRKVFKLDEDPAIRELFAAADAAHVKWMTEGESAYWACSDQFVSGVAKGSKYYPRIITTALWME